MALSDYIEDDPKYAPVLDPLFGRAGRGLRLVTSAITLPEVLVVPIRRGQLTVADRYEELLTKSIGIALIDITIDQLRAAAGLRVIQLSDYA